MLEWSDLLHLFQQCSLTFICDLICFYLFITKQLYPVLPQVWFQHRSAVPFIWPLVDLIYFLSVYDKAALLWPPSGLVSAVQWSDLCLTSSVFICLWQSNFTLSSRFCFSIEVKWPLFDLCLTSSDFICVWQSNFTLSSLRFGFNSEEQWPLFDLIYFYLFMTKQFYFVLLHVWFQHRSKVTFVWPLIDLIRFYLFMTKQLYFVLPQVWFQLWSAVTLVWPHLFLSVYDKAALLCPPSDLFAARK